MVVDMFYIGGFVFPENYVIAVEVESEPFEPVGEVLDRALYQHAVVVHDDDVVDESFHVLNNMRSKEYGFMFGLTVFPHVVDEEAAVAGVETQREVIEDKQVGVFVPE